MKRICWIVVVFGILLAAASGWYAWQVRETANAAVGRLLSVSRQVGAAFASSSTGDGSDADGGPAALLDAATVHEACRDIHELDRTVRPLSVLAGLTAPIARAGQNVSSRLDLLVARIDLVRGTRDVTAALANTCEALEPLTRPGEEPDLQVVLAQLARERESLRSAVEQLSSAGLTLSQIDERQLGERERQLLGTLRGRLPDGAGALALLAELPTILGYDHPVTYLVLGQNNDELRPTGGFTGTSGYITLDHGKLVSAEYGSSFGVKVPPDLRVPPPEPLRRYMGAAYWHLAEANWWPDFPSSARQAEYFSDLVHPTELAGVVALNQDAVASLIDITGPIAVDGYDEVVTSENVRQRLDYQVHVVSGADEAQRKQFVSAMFSTLMRRLASMSTADARRAPVVALRSLERQDVLLWFNDPRSARATSMLHWDGGMLPTSGDEDYLYIVSANVGENKVNRDVSQEAQYDVSEDVNGELIGHLRIVFENRHDPSEYWPYKTTDYVNYLRIYVPKGSELISSRGFGADAETTVECDRTTFAGLVTVPSGQRGLVDLDYRLPSSVTAENHQLLIQKQPGVGAFPLSVSLLGARRELGDELQGFRVLRRAGEHVTSSRLLPSGASRDLEPACQVWTTPPQQLLPPSRIVIPGLKVDATVRELGTSSKGVPEIPESAGVVGWYRQSARPGQVGNVVMVGRPSTASESAVLEHLGSLAPGSSIDLLDESTGRHRYIVEWVRQVDRSSANVAEIMGPTTRRWLTLITWKGGDASVPSDRQEWTIVRATLAEPEP